MNCTKPLKGLVKYIECGNELDRRRSRSAATAAASTDWNPAYWPSFRGVIRGMIDGVKAVDPTIKCGVNVGIPMAYRALQMLWNGIIAERHGATVSAARRTCAGTSRRITGTRARATSSAAGRNNACVDVLQVLKDSFGVPIWLTEFGWSGSAGHAAVGRGLRDDGADPVQVDQGQVQHPVGS